MFVQLASKSGSVYHQSLRPRQVVLAGQCINTNLIFIILEMSYAVEEDLSTEDGIKQAFQRLEDREKEISKMLDGYLAKQVNLESRLKGITKSIPELQKVNTDADQLYQMIKHTAFLAEKVSEKVKRLDTTRSRVSECQQRVHDLLDLQLCCDGAEEALKNEDFEKAAAHVHRFLLMDRTVLKQTADDVEDNSNVDKSFTVLQDISNKLHIEISKKFDDAVKDEDLASVERFFKIYPLLNLHDEGLERYSNYLSSKLAEASKKNLEVALERCKVDKKPNVIFADTVTLLLEGTARVIETHQPLVVTYYGPGKLLTLIKYLQEECDKLMEVIMSRFYRIRDLDKKIKLVKDYNRHLKMSEKVDSKVVDVLLGELTLIHYKTDLYFRFVRRHVLNDTKSSEDPELCKNCDELIQNSKVYKKMQIVLNDYLLLENYYMEESIQKAILLNTIPEEGSITSSMVDDVFFIIRKCVRRSASSSSLDGVCSIINYACSFLEKKYCDIIRKQLMKGYPSGFMDLTQAYNALQSSFQQGRLQASDTEQAKMLFLTNLNNADKSLEFIEILRISLGEEITKAFPRMSEKEKVKVENGLSGLGAVRFDLDKIKDEGLKQLLLSVESRIKNWVEEFLNYDHILSEEDVSNYESTEKFVELFIANLSNLLKSFKVLLTPSNYESLVNLLTSEITKNMEKVILDSYFNRYGGLILDKEIRTLISYLTSITSWSIRDKFSRLTQIVTLLNLEKVSEISDWEKSGVVWQLSLKEKMNVLKLRRDFSSDDIKLIFKL